MYYNWVLSRVITSLSMVLSKETCCEHVFIKSLWNAEIINCPPYYFSSIIKIKLVPR